MTESAQPGIPKRGLGRSPAYPYIDLEAAVRRTRELRQAVGTHPVPTDAAVDSWGLSPKGSAGRQTLSALRYFGLIESAGRGDDREVKISDLALDILYSEEGSQEWFGALRIAALKPGIHTALWREYDGNLPPSDRPIELKLIREKGFNDNTVGDLIAQFRATLSYAELPDSDNMPLEEEDIFEEATEPVVVTKTREQERRREEQPAPKGQRAIPLPISTGDWPTINVPVPMSESEWTEMLAVLNAVKGGIVTTPQPEQSKASDSKEPEEDEGQNG